MSSKRGRDGDDGNGGQHPRRHKPWALPDDLLDLGGVDNPNQFAPLPDNEIQQLLNDLNPQQHPQQIPAVNQPQIGQPLPPLHDLQIANPAVGVDLLGLDDIPDNLLMPLEPQDALALHQEFNIAHLYQPQPPPQQPQPPPPLSPLGDPLGEAQYLTDLGNLVDRPDRVPYKRNPRMQQEISVGRDAGGWPGFPTHQLVQRDLYRGREPDLPHIGRMTAEQRDSAMWRRLLMHSLYRLFDYLSTYAMNRRYGSVGAGVDLPFRDSPLLQPIPLPALHNQIQRILLMFIALWDRHQQGSGQGGGGQ